MNNDNKNNIKNTVSKTNFSENSIDNGRDNTIDHHHRTTPLDPAQEMVRDWEVMYPRIRLTLKIRELALLAASIHILEYRGIIVNDLKKLRISNDNAEKKLQDARRLGLLVPHKTLRIGKQKQYYLSNYIYIVNEGNNKRDKTEILPNDVSLLLARELSDRKYVYHNIHLETALNYKEDYNLFKWNILSPSNKQKVKRFKLEARRNCSIVISYTGTVNISIECTLQPYEFHTLSGLVSFFASCGQIWKLLQIETDDRLTVVPPIYEWYLQRFDYDKDIPIKELESGYATVTNVSRSSKGILKLKYLGALFQIYCKPMPGKGECVRVDGHYTTSGKKKAVKMVGDIASASASETVKKHPFTTAEELLRDRRKMQE